MSQPDDDLKMIEELERLEREASLTEWQFGNDAVWCDCDSESQKEVCEFVTLKNGNLITFSRNNLPRLLALARIGVAAVQVVDEEVNRYLFESRAALSTINAFRDMLGAYKEEAK